MKLIPGSIVLTLGLVAGACTSADRQTAAGTLDRTVLPIAAPEYPAITELDARNAEAPPAFTVEAPDGAPNVVIVFDRRHRLRGPRPCSVDAIQTPTLDRLAHRSGLRYNQFHTTALCSPTRMAILTGRNHHSANAGSVMEVATAFPGNQGQAAAKRWRRSRRCCG